VTKICPACSEENPDRARFCLACASPLDAPVPALEERKIISVLFVDLVGSTARADRADPEDVRALLRPYHERVKLEIERFGGTVEKFVGDAVMAVFGAPVAHEDDAERAVRAALAILDAIDALNVADGRLNLAVRGAVATGEALVSLDARPERGDAIAAGDVLNVAARLQQVAPVGSFVVSEATYRATAAVVEYEELPPADLKGKSERTRMWRALHARSRFGVDVEQPAAAPLIGRDHELALLKEAWARAVHEPSVQLLTIVGEPGVGKSRLVSEFRQLLDADERLIWWRQGRCLPYGEGITFWALGEVVKAQAGVLESDDAETTTAKLGTAVAALVEDPSEREWTAARLGLLVGLSATGATEREETFTAWRRFLEALAAMRPLVLVMEDLHWADDAMLEFLEYLVDWTTDLPLLVLCTARPELYERIPGWGGGKRNSATISLAPLSRQETAKLVAALLSKSVLSAETHGVLLERSGGNPLYAEEFVRMLGDRGAVGDGTDPHVPESVQAVVAARLDTLSQERKALMYAASVVGKVFWAGAVAAVAGVEADEVRQGLRELVRKELIRPSRASSIHGEDEFTFWHALVRDVAYQQIPRADRARKHRVAAEWIGAVASERVAEHAEILVHHYTEAADLARAIGEDPEPDERALRRFLAIAAERAVDLDAKRAVALYERALALPDFEGDHAELSTQAALPLLLSGLIPDARRLLEEAVALLDNGRKPVALGEALLYLGLSYAERPEEVEFCGRALAVLERERPTRSLSEAYLWASQRANIEGRYDHALDFAEKALQVATAVGADDLAVASAKTRGWALAHLGARDALTVVAETVERAVASGYGAAAGMYNDYALLVWLEEGPLRAHEIVQQAIAFSERRLFDANSLRTLSFRMLHDLGRWDEFLALADEVLADEERRGVDANYLAIANRRALIFARRGEVGTAERVLGDILDQARRIGDAQTLEPALVTTALMAGARGEAQEVLALASEFETALERPAFGRDIHLPDWTRLTAAASPELAERLVDRTPETFARSRHAILSGRAIIAEARRDHEVAVQLNADAARDWSAYGNVYEEGQALLGIARCRLARGEPDVDAAERARTIFAGIGVPPLLAEADALLGRQPEAARAAK
jgi:class 3 adenylate cyclase/tetratricopeptide (TPR) repeat protein